ncbi:hypothetical protein EMIT0210MI2_10495 [Priestia megaterium]
MNEKYDKSTNILNKEQFVSEV